MRRKKVGRVIFTFYNDGTVKTGRAFDTQRKDSFKIIEDAHKYVIKTFVEDMRTRKRCPFHPDNRK